VDWSEPTAQPLRAPSLNEKRWLLSQVFGVGLAGTNIDLVGFIRAAADGIGGYAIMGLIAVEIIVFRDGVWPWR
jgi:hypothetical protein